MSFFTGWLTGLLTGLVLSESKRGNAQPVWKPGSGTVYGHAYLGEGTDFPSQVLVSGRQWPENGTAQRILVKWIGIGASPADFDFAQWGWKRSEWVGGQLHLLDPKKIA